MGISAIVHIADRLLSRGATENQDNQPRARNITSADKNQSNRTDFGDQFTQSGETNGTAASGGELLTAEFFRFTAIAVQTGAAANAPAAAPAGQTPAPIAQTPANTTTANAANTAVNILTPTVAATTPTAAAAPATAAPPATIPTIPATAAPAPAPATAAAAATNNQTQADLQALNSSLSALGLNAAEIAAFDQFATLLLQFDPNGLQELQNELNLLAARFQAQGGAAANAAQTATPAAVTTQAATTNGATATQATPGFQLSELSVTFNAVSLTNSPANGNSRGGTTQISAVSLQIQEINVTLGTPTGQAAQIQVSPNSKPAGGSATPKASPATRAATA